MSKFNGTKGSWFIKGQAPVEGKVHLLFGDADPNGKAYLVGGICVWSDEEDSAKEAIANSKLIAAAPDLLCALQEMQRNAQKQGWNDKYESSMEKTRLAIAKALGQ